MAVGLLIAFVYKVVELTRESGELRAVRWEWQDAADATWQREVAFTGTPAVWALGRAARPWFEAYLPDEAQWALTAMDQASVGVYRIEGTRACPTERILQADVVLGRRGWSRRVGVCEGDQVLGIYSRGDVGLRTQVCVVVGDGKQVVLVSGGLREGAIETWAAAWTFGDMRRLARL